MPDDHAHYMRLAMEHSRAALARGNRPVAALIVRDGAIIGIGENSVFSDNDPSAHGEVMAIRNACAALKTTSLTGASLYTAMEPCPMCMWATIESGISRLVLGARHARVGRQPLGHYTVESFLAFTDRRIELITGVLEAECEEVRRDWLKAGA